jgi:hypothetical protein
MANSEVYGRTSYFRVIEGKEAEFIAFVRQLGGEGQFDLIVDATTKPENLPEGEFRTDPRGFAIIDVDGFEIVDEETGNSEEVFDQMARDFLRPSCGIIYSYACKEKMRYVGGGVSAIYKDASGGCEYDSIHTMDWYQNLLREWEGLKIEATVPEY